MSSSLHRTILRHAESLAVGSGEGLPCDAVLLRRFQQDRDTAAFTGMVVRHGPMVWNICRNSLRTDADAEDAFQATFLVLVRSAHAIRDPKRLSSWLHGVAMRVCQKTRQAAHRRQKHELKATQAEGTTATVPDSTWEQLLAAVHEEVHRLPASMRDAFVLCGLEGLRQQDAAERLGCSVNTLTVRLTRARQRLLDALARRGIAPAVAGGALGTSALSTAQAPASLIHRTADGATSGASIPDHVLSLTQGVLSMTTSMQRLAALLVVGGGLALSLGTATLAQQPNPWAQRQPSSQATPPRTADSPAPRIDNDTRPSLTPSEPTADPYEVLTALQATAASKPARLTWQYKVVSMRTQNVFAETYLNELGQQGWELVTATEYNLIFKRAKTVVSGGPLRMDSGMMGGPAAGGGMDPLPAAPARTSIPDRSGRPSGSFGPDALPGGGMPGGGMAAMGGMGPDMSAGLPANTNVSPAAQRLQNVQIITLKHVDADEIARTITTLLGRDGRDAGSKDLLITPNRRNNTLLVIVNDDDTLKALQALIQKLDVPDTRQGGGRGGFGGMSGYGGGEGGLGFPGGPGAGVAGPDGPGILPGGANQEGVPLAGSGGLGGPPSVPLGSGNQPAPSPSTNR